MAADQVLRDEARWRPRMAVIAAVSAVLLMAGAVLQLTGPHPKVNELTLGLLVEHKRYARDLISAVLTSFGDLGVAATVIFLWTAARARNAQTQQYIRPLAILGGVVAAVAGVVGWIEVGRAVHTFVTTGAQTYQQANHLTSSSAVTIPGEIGYGGNLLLAVAIVLVALAALRVGLLTRFMGYFGMFAGVLFLFPLIPVPAVQCYWLAALAYLLWGRWPTGVPRAWSSGRAEPWPSTQELREQRIRAQGARGGGRAEPVPEPVGAGARRSGSAPQNASSSPSARSGARTGQKRKRKRRK
jgi:hypothetical protein